MKAINRAGQTFGHLSVLRLSDKADRQRQRSTSWLCLCSCGALVDVRTDHLTGGQVVSCGCLRTERIGNLRRSHGETAGGRPSIEYRAWSHMKGRCENPSDGKFKNYGARGIAVCEKWRESFQAFLADIGRRPEGKTSVGRMDVNKNYEPGNVRWENAYEQGRARTNNVIVEVDGAPMILKDAAASLGYDYKRFHKIVRVYGAPVALLPRRKARPDAR